MYIHSFLDDLRRLINYIKIFDTIDTCRECVQQTLDTRTFLICSNDIIESLLATIDHLHHIRGIYIYSIDGTDLPKIHRVYVTFDDLIDALTIDVKKFIDEEKNGMFGELNQVDRSTDSGSESWWVTFMDTLCLLSYPTKECHQNLVNELKRYYEGKHEELNAIEQFQRDYTSDKAVWWYTRDIFLFRLINKANRQHNVKVMFAFGYYIKDLFVQLNKEYQFWKRNNNEHNREMKVFRGQIMSKEEIQLLKSSYMIRLNSFLSTSIDRHLAVSFLPSISSMREGFVRVLLQIDLNGKENCKPFANISHLSEFSNENEVLLMIGTFLRLRQSSFNEDDNMITLILSLEDDYILPFDDQHTSNATQTSLTLY